MPKNETIESFAETIAGILKTDRWVLLCCDGDMGEGKSSFTSQLSKAVAKRTGTPFSFDGNMTFKRKELKEWIDGDKDGNKMPEYSSALADELISMFFKRNWFEDDQIEGIELLNKCRDRHLFVAGNIPNFWDLDSGILPIFTFRVHIYERGLAWVFTKDRNPFAKDKWHIKYNEKKIMKHGNPYRCKGFVCEILYDDWNPEDKKEYYEIRNKKRVGTEGQRGEKKEKYRFIKEQRDSYIRYIGENTELTNQAIADISGTLSEEAIRKIKNGER